MKKLVKALQKFQERNLIKIFRDAERKRRKVKVWDGKIILDPRDCQYYAVKNGKRKYIDFDVFTDKTGMLIFIEE